MARYTRLLFVGVKHFVVALDEATGTEVWRTKLKGSDFVSLHRSGERLFAANQGEVYCLDVIRGEVLWHNPLKGLGMGLVTLASTPAAEAEAELPYVSTAAMKKRQQAAQAAAAAG